MQVVDAQVHIWQRSTAKRPWPAGRAHEAHRRIALSARVLAREMSQADVDRAILVPPSWEGDRNDVACRAAADYPGKFAVMGRVSASRPFVPGTLNGWRLQPGMLGVRLTFHRPEERRMLEMGAVDSLWSELEHEGLPVMVYAPGLLRRIGEVASRYPRLRLIVDHAGLPLDVRDGAVWDQLAKLWPLSIYKNVAVKASALPCHVTETFPFPTLEAVMARMIKAFGADRVFWGSDLTRLPCRYEELIRFFRGLPFLSEEELEWVMGKGIMNWLEWKPTP